MVIRRRKSKVTQYNGQKWSTKRYTENWAKDRTPRTQPKTGDELGCFARENSSWDTRRVTLITRDRRSRDHMVVGFTATYAIGDYHRWTCKFESRCTRYNIMWHSLSANITISHSLISWLFASSNIWKNISTILRGESRFSLFTDWSPIWKTNSQKFPTLARTYNII